MPLADLLAADLGRVFLNPADFGEVVTVTPLDEDVEAWELTGVYSPRLQEAQLGQATGTLGEPTVLCRAADAALLAEGDLLTRSTGEILAVTEVSPREGGAALVRVVPR